MEMFEFTRKKIFTSLIDLKKELTVEFKALSNKWDSGSNRAGWTKKQIAEHVYLINQYAISRIKFVRSLLIEGLVNNEVEYNESDLSIVETMLNVSVFRLETPPEFIKDMNFSAEEMKMKLMSQVYKLGELLDSIPGELISNFKEKTKFIPGIQLDIYQMIYLSIIHCKHHFEKIKTIELIDETLVEEVHSY